MRVLFLISDRHWNGRARAFALAASGLAARGHEVFMACAESCPVQTRLAGANLPIVPLSASATAAGDTIQLRRELQSRGVDVVFVHTDAEQLTVSSALRLGGGAGAVIRRIPPFAVARQGAGARVATRLAPSGLLFSTEADLQAAAGQRYSLPPALAPLGLDTAPHDAVTPVPKASFSARPDARLIVCVNDGSDKRSVLAPMRTLSLLSPRHPELHLVVVGAPNPEELRMQGAALGINDMMTLLGSREDDLAVLRAADVGWVAAEGDTAALAALDFMALRVPVVADRTPLTEHYVADGITGLLLPRADPTATAASVAAFLAQRGQHAAMGAAGRSRVQREFGFETMIAGYERAMQGGSRRGALAAS